MENLTAEAQRKLAADAFFEGLRKLMEDHLIATLEVQTGWCFGYDAEGMSTIHFRTVHAPKIDGDEAYATPF